ncbi:MAG: hypothetical protein IMW97_00565 [Firmicutes bacterium]|nr:hypothetical protein [Candidatus Fermentithermobacillaceae bacterium]
MDGEGRDFVKPARIIVGCMEDAGTNVPVVALSLATFEEAREVASIILSCQNGSKPFSSGPPVYVGDTRVRVTVLDANPYYVEIDARKDRRHLTSAYYVMSPVPRETVEPFLKLFELVGHYVLTVAVSEKPVLEMLDLVKYVIYRKKLREGTLNR